MNVHSAIRHAAFGIVLACLLHAIGCGEDGREASAQDARVTNVAVYPVAPDSLTRYSRLPVTARAWRDATLSFLEGGTVAEIFREMGDRVTEGEILARLEADLLEAAAIQGEADLKFQTYNFERIRKLHGEGSVSEHDLYTAEFNLKRAESNAETVRRRLRRARLRAPFSGEIAQRMVEVGQLAGAGTPAFRLVQTDRMKAEAWIPENEIADFSEGGRVEIAFDAYPDRAFSGVIGRIGPASDSARRVFPLEVHLPNPDGRIRPGMIGKLRAVRRTYREVVVIPREAVLEREAGPAVFVVQGNIARLRQLTLGASEGDRVVVEDGLVFGDRVIVKGGRDLIEGDRVRVTEKPVQ